MPTSEAVYVLQKLQTYDKYIGARCNRARCTEDVVAFMGRARRITIGRTGRVRYEVATRGRESIREVAK